MIDVAPLADRALELRASGMETWSTMCARIGWTEEPNGRAQTSRLQRALGLRPYCGGNAPWKYKRFISVKLATLICSALDLDPVDLGL